MLFLDVQKAKCTFFSVECLMSLSNYKSLSSFLEPFILPGVLFLADFYLLEKECNLVKWRSENLVPTCLKTFLSGNFFLMTALVGCCCLGGPPVSLMTLSLSLLVAQGKAQQVLQKQVNKLNEGIFELLFPPVNLNGAFLLTVLTKYMYACAWNVFTLTSHRLHLVGTLVFEWDFCIPKLHLVARKLASSMWAQLFWVPSVLGL